LVERLLLGLAFALSLGCNGNADNPSLFHLDSSAARRSRSGGIISLVVAALFSIFRDEPGRVRVFEMVESRGLPNTGVNVHIVLHLCGSG
jgi:hypothetical protein